MFSAVHLLGMNVVWLFLIILAWSKSISKNLSSALVYKVAARYRPKVPIFEGFGTLGTKVVMVELELTSLSSLPVLKKDITALVCYDPR